MLRSFSRVLPLLFCLLVPAGAWSQTVSAKLAAAYHIFQDDPQLRNAVSSLYVQDAKTGRVVYDKNGLMGLAPASTMKVITSISAYELLGKNFRYETKFARQQNQQESALVILPGGDPTLGSWRWRATREEVVLQHLTQAIRKAGITAFSAVYVDNQGWEEESVPGGWIWQDIGNYYGAGPAKLNWRENQFDVLLKSGRQVGDPVQIVATHPHMNGYKLQSNLTSAAAGSGDNAYIYFPLNGAAGVIRGTIPVNESHFKISGAMPGAADQFVRTLADTLTARGIPTPKKAGVQDPLSFSRQPYTLLHTVTSPPLDSILYWFNQKSINLYGEALIRTMAFKNKGLGSTEAGTDLVRAFWKQKGIPESELNLVDGSGLSPLNRVTTRAQVTLLQYARKQPWFAGFYACLPEYNRMKMKSGTIRGVKGYCGYHRAKDGQEYVFSFLVNNYNGPSATLVQKMYRVLDVLK
jgi:D-alanyl-D-alanine carboxypeptidase/D-alanyl-D-alanine-endopeptidase (penicillin-binding protein 4)